jgi:hypothetical protein
MRLWSINPGLLDPIGLRICWANAVLALKTLNHPSPSYANHSPLIRFRDNAHISLFFYMNSIRDECLEIRRMRRHLTFTNREFREFMDENEFQTDDAIEVTAGQLKYEFALLQSRLYWRNRKKYIRNKRHLQRHQICLHGPVFVVRAHDDTIETWERPIPSIVKRMDKLTNMIDFRNL